MIPCSFRLSGKQYPLEQPRSRDWKRTVVHPLSTRPAGLAPSACSGPVTLRHPNTTTYRCFLPDLTGFIGFRRADQAFNATQRHQSPEAKTSNGIQPRYSGLRVQGTASSPSSTTARHPTMGRWLKSTPQAQCAHRTEAFQSRKRFLGNWKRYTQRMIITDAVNPQQIPNWPR